MKKRNRLLSWLLIFAMMITTFTWPATEVKAEIIDGKYNTSDPKAFWEACRDYNDEKPLFANNNIYFATKAKTAASGVGVRWRSVGWAVTVGNSAGSMTVEVDSRGGKYLKSLTPGADDKSYSDGYTYGLFALNYDTLSALCRNKNEATAKAIFSKPTVYITLNAICAVNYNGTMRGDIVGEDGKGNVTPTGTLYRVANISELNTMISTYDFSENTRKSITENYRNLRQEVTNNPLTIQYYADTKANAPSYSSVSNGAFTGSSKPTSTVATSTTHH